MKREDLTKLGLTDEQTDAIMKAHGQDIESHKSKLTTLQAEADALKAQVAEAGTAIEGFKKLDVDGIKAAADEWKLKAEKAQKDAADSVAALKFDYSLRDALKAYKVKDPEDVMPKLKRDVLKVGEDGKITGLEEQITALKTTKDYLFTSDTPAPQIVKGGNSQSILGDKVMDRAREAAGLVTPKQG